MPQAPHSVPLTSQHPETFPCRSQSSKAASPWSMAANRLRRRRSIGRVSHLRRFTMPKLVRMDQTGHTVIAEWNAAEAASSQRARAAFDAQLQEGYFAVSSRPDGTAEQVRELPLDASL